MKYSVLKVLFFCTIISLSLINASAQENGNSELIKWISPLNAGIEYSNITHIGPVMEYRVFKGLHVVCKLEYNTNIKSLFLLPGLKYNFRQFKYGFSPFIDLQFNKLDHIQHHKYGTKEDMYCTAWEYDPITGVSSCTNWDESTSSDGINYNGISLLAGLEVPIKKFVITVGIGPSYFPKIEIGDHRKLLAMYAIGLYYSFSDYSKSADNR